MRIGIVADIHDAVGPVRVALRQFQELGVEKIVTMGDAFETFEPGSPGAQVARDLADAGAIGVWGNHDVGLSHELSAEVRALADPALLAFAERLRPHLVLGECRFCHIEPWRDPRRLEDLWAFDGIPETAEDAVRSFQAVPERVLFIGHFHMWRLIRPGGPVPWDADRPFLMCGPDRYLALVSAVVEGWCAVFDTEVGELTPIRCPA